MQGLSAHSWGCRVGFSVTQVASRTSAGASSLPAQHWSQSDVLQEPCLRDEPLIHNCKGHGLGQCRASGDLGFLVREEANGLLV